MAADLDHEILRTRVAELLDARAFVEAVELLTQLIELDPENEAAHRQRGVVRSALGDTDGALADLDRAVELAPDEPLAWARRAELRVATGDLAAAAVDVQRAFELDDECVVAWTTRASIRERSGDLVGGEADLTRALDLDPDSAWILTTRAGVRGDAGNLEGALTDIRRALDRDPSYAYGWARQSDLAVKAGDHELAAAAASRAIALDPDNPWGYSNRGLAREELGDLEGAIADFSRVIDLDPADAWAWSARGTARADGDDLDGALTDLGRATELSPEDELAWTNLGRVLLDLGDAARAIEAVTRAIDLGSDDAYTYALRARARLIASDFENLTAQMAEGSPTLETLMALASNSSDVTGAMADLTRAFDLDPRVALEVLGGGEIDSSVSADDLQPLVDGTRWLIAQRPDDLDEILAAVPTAMKIADDMERLSQLLMLEAVLELRVSKAVDGADVAHAATLDLIFPVMTAVRRQGSAADSALDELRTRMESTRAALSQRSPGGLKFDRDVDALKSRLVTMPTQLPPTEPTTT